MEKAKEVFPPSIKKQIEQLTEGLADRFEFVDYDILDVRKKGYTLYFNLKFIPQTTSQEFRCGESTARILGNRIVAQGNFPEIKKILTTLIW